MSKNLDISDLPSDQLGVLQGLRAPLIAAYNRTRETPAYAALLKATLETIVAELPEVSEKDTVIGGMPVRVTPEMLRERAAKRKAEAEKAAAPKAPAKKNAPKEDADS